MQSVYVLRDDRFELSLFFEESKGFVGLIWLCSRIYEIFLVVVEESLRIIDEKRV